MVEILKQPQYAPMPVANQVAVIYAVTNGYLDAVPVEQIRKWERGFHDYLAGQAADVLEGIRTEKMLSDELTERLVAAITAYNEQWTAEQGAAAAEPAPAAT